MIDNNGSKPLTEVTKTNDKCLEKQKPMTDIQKQKPMTDVKKQKPMTCLET